MPFNFIDTDQQLLTRIATGDNLAFELLYRRYFSKLYGSVYKRLQDRPQTEEVIQELFVSLWERRVQLITIENAENYLFGAAKYLVIARFKQNSLLEKYRTDGTDPDGYGNFTEQTVAFDELNAAYSQALLQLPERCRAVFTLSRSGLSQREISEQLDISEKTVESQISKALRILRQLLRHYTVLV